MTLVNKLTKSGLLRGTILALGSLAGTISVAGIVVFLAYVHLMSLSSYQLVFA